MGPLHVSFLELAKSLRCKPVAGAGYSYDNAERLTQVVNQTAAKSANRLRSLVPQPARVAVDAAQLAPHCPISMCDLDVDFLAMSGHKLYAPYGAGALLGRADWLSQGDPFLAGGGAVDFVTVNTVQWTDLLDRQEAGSPNVTGAVAFGVACNFWPRQAWPG